MAMRQRCASDLCQQILIGEWEEVVKGVVILDARLAGEADNLSFYPVQQGRGELFGNFDLLVT